MVDLSQTDGFEWDEGNLNKNQAKHNVTVDECEQVFVNQPIRFFDDQVHSKNEKRFGLLGKTNQKRQLTIFFTIRRNKIRVISARDQSKNDRLIYQQAIKEFEQGGEVKTKI